MSHVSKISVALTPELAALISQAVEGGEYATSSEVIREALREWKLKRDVYSRQLEALRVDIGRGLADVAEGWLVPYDRGRILERGRKQFANRANSALPRSRKQT